MGLGDSWHKVMIYFGISDDEEYDDEETLAPPEELERSYQDRPNVRKLSRSSRGRQADYDDIFADEPPARQQRPPSCAPSRRRVRSASKSTS